MLATVETIESSSSENLLYGYIETAVDGSITEINPTLLRWLGRTSAPSNIQELLHLIGRIYFETHVIPHLAVGGYVEEVAIDLLHVDGSSAPMLLNGSVVLSSAGTPQRFRYAVFTARLRRRYERELLSARREADAANRKLRELNDTLEQRVTHEVAERLKTEAALRQSQKMDALGHLTGGVAHDFNNLLTVIIGGLDTIGRHLEGAPVVPESARLRRASNMAMQGARSAASLTHRLLAFARQQPLDPKPIDTNKVVASMSELLRRTLGESIALETVLGAGLWSTSADENQLQNAMLNLAVNARDAMPDGGMLTIETANTVLDEAYVTNYALTLSPGQYVCISVTDTGFGMDATTLERVFEPFFTTKITGKGTGLGLSQVYGFVHQSGGHVRIYSEVAQGSSVKIYLPRFTGTSEPACVEPTVTASDAVKQQCVLVVEDDALVREHAVQALEELGCGVIEVADAKTAVDTLERVPAITVLFTDVVLAGSMQGEELVTRALAIRPDLKVLFTTGYARSSLVHQKRLPDNARLLSKPYTVSDLARELRKVVETA